MLIPFSLNDVRSYARAPKTRLILMRSWFAVRYAALAEIFSKETALGLGNMPSRFQEYKSFQRHRPRSSSLRRSCRFEFGPSLRQVDDILSTLTRKRIVFDDAASRRLRRSSP